MKARQMPIEPTRPRILRSNGTPIIMPMANAYSANFQPWCSAKKVASMASEVIIFAAVQANTPAPR